MANRYTRIFGAGGKARFLIFFDDFLTVGEAALVADWVTAWKPSGEAALCSLTNFAQERNSWIGR